MTLQTTPSTADSIERLSRATIRVSKSIANDDSNLATAIEQGSDRVAKAIGSIATAINRLAAAVEKGTVSK